MFFGTGLFVFDPAAVHRSTRSRSIEFDRALRSSADRCCSTSNGFYLPANPCVRV
jgi:hypothetical protein